MNRIIEAINKTKEGKAFKESTRNFGYRFDESTDDRVEVSFDVLGMNKSERVSISLEKLSETYAIMTVKSKHQNHQTKVPYKLLSEALDNVAWEEEDILNGVE